LLTGWLSSKISPSSGFSNPAVILRKVDFPQRRVQTFSPASGKPSINKVLNNLNQFIDESFVEGEYNMKHNYIKQPSKKNCRWCEFNQTVHCDVGVK